MWQENNITEFKSELTDNLEKEVIAFLNSKRGGDIYIGVDDDGKVLGIKQADKLQLQITDRLKNNIEPTYLGLFDVYPEEKDNKIIMHIVVGSGTEKPYYLKKFGMSPKGCFIRISSSSQPMDRNMIDTLFASRTHTSLRNIKSPKKDLRFEQLKIYYQEKGLNINDAFLQNLDLYTDSGELNYVAYLLADNNTLSFKVAKYSGTDKVDLIENEEFGFCSLVKATKSILDKLDIENRTFTKITGSAERLQKSMIDKTALREALINAMVHNDYSREITPVVEIYANRLSITSYGGLVSGLSREELFQGRSIPRNRELMRVFRDLDLVEHLGSGVHRILKAYGKDIFYISDNFFEISFPFEKDYLEWVNKKKDTEQVSDTVTPQDTPQVKKLLFALTSELGRVELQKKLGLADRENFRINYLLPALDTKLIEMTIPDKPNSRNQKYRLTAKGKQLKKQLEVKQ